MTALAPYPLFAALDRQTAALLTREQEHALAVRARSGDHRARGELVERNLRLVIKIASGVLHRAPQLELHDLVSEGVIGLMRAIEKFDPHAGFKLSTYATWWITQAVGRAIDRDGAVTMPADVRREVRAAEQHLAVAHGDGASTDEVHAELSPAMRSRIDRSDVAAARAGMRCTSLDYAGSAVDGQTTPVASFVADPHAPDPGDEVARLIDLQADVAAATAPLDDRERTLVEQRFGLGGKQAASLAAVAKHLQLEVDEVRRVERRAVVKMRQAAGAETDTQTPCQPAAAVLDLLRCGRRELPVARLAYAAGMEREFLPR